jgi:hypothetical protein
VTIFVVVLLAGLALLLLSRGRPGATRRAGARAGVSGWWLLAGLVVCALLVRFGLSWLAVVGGVLLTVARGVGPLLRLLPLLQYFQRQRAAEQTGHADAGAPPGNGAAARPGRMSRREALEVLGLDDRATREDVQREYKRLIKRLHPDLGGSTYLTAKLNEARDVLS